LGKATVSGVRVGAARAVPAMPGMMCCECKFEGASKWHLAMHDWVEKNRCVFRFGCRNVACLELHTLDEQEHKQATQKLRQREWEAECGFCGVGACRYGSDCQRATRQVVYDSAYEDDEDGWSVVGDGGRCSVGAKPVGRIDVVRLGVLGRFGALVETEEEDIPGDGFYNCLCDGPEFQFVFREERRVRQQERRKQEGQQRRGRTSRKRAAAKDATVQRIGRDAAVTRVRQSHQVRKRLCWLRAKLLRTVSLWCAAIGVARACYGAQDGGEWRLLESQMEQQLGQDERFWEDAVHDCKYREKLVCFGEEQRLSISMAQMDRLKKIAAEGKSERLQAEKRRIEWLAGATDRRQELAVHDKRQRALQRKRAQMGYTDDLSSTEEECYDLCYDNVSNGGVTCHLEYDNSEYEKMRHRYCSGSQYEFSNVQ
jgi:hypothetical protein